MKKNISEGADTEHRNKMEGRPSLVRKQEPYMIQTHAEVGSSVWERRRGRWGRGEKEETLQVKANR